MLKHLTDDELKELNSLYDRFSLPNKESRKKDVVEQGYDKKHAYHVVRLLNEVEQILIEGDLDLLRNNEQLKSIRRGEWSLTEIEDYFKRKEAHLETAYANSSLPHSPDQDKIKIILLNCLEEHYRSLSFLLKIQKKSESQLLSEMKALIAKYE